MASVNWSELSNSNVVARHISFCHGISFLTGAKEDFFAGRLNPFWGDDQNAFKKGDQIQSVFPLDQMCKVILSGIISEIF
jgi:hypothetical protein